MHRLSDEMVPVLCFDETESELALSVVFVHDRVVAARGFNPALSEEQLDETVGRILVVVSSAFCTIFDSHPSDRFKDVFEQVADFAMHLSKGHIFNDANKRTTVVCLIGILNMAGLLLDIEDSDEPEDNVLYQWIKDVVTDAKSVPELAQILRDHARYAGNGNE